MSLNWPWRKRKQKRVRIEPGEFVQTVGSKTRLGCEPCVRVRQSDTHREQRKRDQTELRRRIEINRERWLANATGPVTQRSHSALSARRDLPGYAVVIGLATVVLLTGISLARQTGEPAQSASADRATARIVVSGTVTP